MFTTTYRCDRCAEEIDYSQHFKGVRITPVLQSSPFDPLFGTGKQFAWCEKCCNELMPHFMAINTPVRIP